jgi:hypothetical protein
MQDYAFKGVISILSYFAGVGCRPAARLPICARITPFLQEDKIVFRANFLRWTVTWELDDLADIWPALTTLLKR